MPGKGSRNLPPSDHPCAGAVGSATHAGISLALQYRLLDRREEEAVGGKQAGVLSMEGVKHALLDLEAQFLALYVAAGIVDNLGSNSIEIFWA